MKLLRTIRFDASDERVFERAAAPEEWAVVGTFAFADAEPDRLTGKALQAFRNGFLGLASFGWSTFVAVATIGEDEREAAIRALGRHLLERYGAPDEQTAMEAARGEIEAASSLCEPPPGTVLAIERRFEEPGIVERFRIVKPQDDQHARIWAIVEDGE